MIYRSCYYMSVHDPATYIVLRERSIVSRVTWYRGGGGGGSVLIMDVHLHGQTAVESKQ